MQLTQQGFIPKKVLLNMMNENGKSVSFSRIAIVYIESTSSKNGIASGRNSGNLVIMKPNLLQF
jgi:hypothetical protein